MLKTAWLIPGCVFAWMMFAAPGFGQGGDEPASSRVDAATAYTFSGKIVFRQQETNVIHDLTVTKGQVSGYQLVAGEDQPVGQIVGGWFDFGQQRLSLLLLADDQIKAKLRCQMQQFRVDPDRGEVTMEHALFGYGVTLEASTFQRAHVLLVLDRIDGGHVEHLVK